MAVGAFNMALWDALRESEQRFRDYSETASDWLWETGPDHRFTRISGHLNAVGAMPSSLIGMARWDYATDVKSEPEKWRLHRATLDAHRPFRDFMYSTVNRVGSAIYIRTGGKPFLDANGNFLGYRGTGTDTTATIRAEHAEKALSKAQAELARVTRVTTLGELTASIAHEVNQLLTGVVTYGGACLRWLDGEVPRIDQARSAVEQMIGSARHASDVIERIRALSKKGAFKSVRLDINQVIDGVIALIRREIKVHGISLRLDLEASLPPIDGDRIQLQQVIMNLLMNGIQAMSAVTDRHRELRIRSREHESDQILVAVEDSGIGIEPEHAAWLFNAFFTTKPDGMGMGLSICRSIIEAHGGRLWATANVPHGATFQFTLPVNADHAS
jgi:PAS domain S-box-containing protein